MDTPEGTNSTVETMLDAFQAGKISRRELVSGIGAAAVGGLLANLVGCEWAAQAQSDEPKDRARVLLSRLANLRVTIGEDDILRTDKTYPLVFTQGESHQAWLFGPDGLLSGSWKNAAARIDERIPQTPAYPQPAEPGQHLGMENRSTDKPAADPVAYTGQHSKTLELRNKALDENMEWISKVFDLKLAICEVEGMFHMGKEVHEWATANCADCADELYDFIIERLFDHYSEYFTDANVDDVETKFENTSSDDDDDGTVSSHVW